MILWHAHRMLSPHGTPWPCVLLRSFQTCIVTDVFLTRLRNHTNVDIVACQGGRVSSKTRRHGADKTLALNPLVR